MYIYYYKYMLIPWVWVLLEYGELNAKHLRLLNAKLQNATVHIRQWFRIMWLITYLEYVIDKYFAQDDLAGTQLPPPAFQFLVSMSFPNGVCWWCLHLVSLLDRLLSRVFPASHVFSRFQPPPPAPHSPVPPHGHLAGRQAVSCFHLLLLLSHLDWSAEEAEEKREGEVVAGNSSYRKVN